MSNQSSKKPQSFDVPDVSKFKEALKVEGFIPTLERKEDGKLLFEEYRNHSHLRTMQTSLKRKDPYSKAEVVSIYHAKGKVKAVTNPEATITVQNILDSLDVGVDV